MGKPRFAIERGTFRQQKKLPLSGEHGTGRKP